MAIADVQNTMSESTDRLSRKGRDATILTTDENSSESDETNARIKNDGDGNCTSLCASSLHFISFKLLYRNP